VQALRPSLHQTLTPCGRASARDIESKSSVDSDSERVIIGTRCQSLCQLTLLELLALKKRYRSRYSTCY
jgi:hypothetical protein